MTEYRKNALYMFRTGDCLLTEKEEYYNYYLPFKEEIDENETFAEYLNNCLSSNNGELIEVKNITKRELIKIVRRCVANADADYIEFEEIPHKWQDLQALTKYELYDILYMYFDYVFCQLVVRW